MKRDFTPELYAATHRGNLGDLAHYRAVCRGTTRILELGAGSGRLLAALARAGREVVGLELDAGQRRLARRTTQELSVTRRGSVKVVAGDMRKFDLGRPFERILLPYNALFCLLTERDARACLRSVRAALAAGGLFAFDVWNADPVLRYGLGTSEADEPLFELTVGQRTFSVFEHTHEARARQRLSVSYRYVAHDASQSFVSKIEQRYLGSKQIKALLESAGFAIQSWAGDFAGTPFRAGSPHLVVSARAR